MNVIRHIRLNLFGMNTQGEFAAAIGVTQATVSRLEAGSEITLTVAKSIRSAAKERGIEWDDALLYEYEAPSDEEAA
jgi:hypothetical protein